jgi:hypothetical protein
MARYVQYKHKRCPYFRSGDEYQIVKKQMWNQSCFYTGNMLIL